MKAFFTILACVLLVGVGCLVYTQLGPTPKPDGKKTDQEFEAAIKTYPYDAPQARRDRIVKNGPRLEVGMSKEQVAELIGDPDYSRLMYGPKGPGARWLGSSWMYYLHKRDSNINVYNPCVQIFFGTDDRATWIVPSNIDGLTEKGSYAR